ncbi:MAG: hypothetical protein ACRD4K_00515 [Candidatus Acidiferrales bacterium]
MIEPAAEMMLLVLYWLLVKGFPALFFRIWMAGWIVYACFSVGQIISAWQSGLSRWMLSLKLSFAPAVLFLEAVLDFLGQTKHPQGVWPFAAMVAVGMQADLLHSGQPVSARWTISYREP